MTNDEVFGDLIPETSEADWNSRVPPDLQAMRAEAQARAQAAGTLSPLVLPGHADGVEHPMDEEGYVAEYAIGNPLHLTDWGAHHHRHTPRVRSGCRGIRGPNW